MNIITRWAMLATATTGLAAAAGLGGCHSSPHDTLANNGKIEGTIEERLARLEQAYAKNAEALDFLRKVYEQQKARETEEEAAPDTMFAVNIADDIKAGQVEGSPQALVTIVEAWDFA